MSTRYDPGKAQDDAEEWQAWYKDHPEDDPELQRRSGFPADLGAQMQAMITAVDAWLDAECGPLYKEQPAAQTWARVAKVTEEHGEAIAELILATGQNPRKKERGSRHRICEELADTAVTAIFAIQHFQKDSRQTLAYFLGAMAKAAGRAEQAGYPS